MMNQVHNAFTLFMSLLVEALPFLLLGVLFSSALLLFVDETKLLSSIPRNPVLGALIGSSIGFLFPVCECGNVPVARRLLMQGASPSVAIGFLLAAPTVNPIVIWSTWTAFRDQPELVVLRVVFSLAIATIIGSIFSLQKDLTPFVQPMVARAMAQSSGTKSDKIRTQDLSSDAPLSSPLLQSGTFLLGTPGSPQRLDATTMETVLLASKAGNFGGAGAALPGDRLFSQRLRLFVENVMAELRELGGVLVLGSAIAAIIQVAAPRDLIISLGQGPVTSIIAMLVLGAVVSICSTVDAFFALSFASTFTTGSLLAFLVFGPMIDIKGIGLMMSIFKVKPLVYLFLISGQLTFLLTLAYNLKFS
ncbi:permease [Laspinema olomoucense]|uniref:permease n=1 Tax=Laspinema olomoucense TaxID=3231600 RepID=UPI003F493EF3